MHKNTFDVIIIGAGPAGSTCAIALQKSGLRVALIDKETFPRDKICGDAVSSVAKRILRQIDPVLEQSLLEFAPKSNIQQAKLYSPDFTTLEFSFTKVGHCIRRKDFDNWLFTHAINNTNITAIQDVKVNAVSTNSTQAVVELADGRVLTGKVLVGCDGAHSIVAKKLGNIKVDRKHYSGAVRQYYRNVKGLSGKALEVYFLKGFLPGYFWIFPLSDNEANVGFGMLSSVITEKKIDLKKSLHDIIHTIPEINDRFKDAEALEDIKGFGLPLGSKKYTISGERFMLCGDAASLIDPFSGEGIETAMESGKFAAEQIIKCYPNNNFSAKALHAYDERVYKKMWSNFKNHYYLQRILSNRVWLIRLLIKVGNIGWVNRKITKLFY
ncbi:MAG: geranylgeranyl reductase family protein [Bacteroidia bacterium]|nr:geranylgeranyl reductase family protein [Bacteroidia bacterium]MCZ2141733.1 geranylgeranyl reductase family protein [Bacteroidia bacterium]